MSAQRPESGQPGTGGQPMWQIVEHVPLPPGRALPPPRTPGDTQWYGPVDAEDDADDADDADDGEEPDDACDTLPKMAASDRPEGSMRAPRVDASDSPLGHLSSPGPATRPLFADLDHLLARSMEETARRQRNLEATRWQRMSEQAARKSARRVRSTRLLVVALLVVAVVLAFAALGPYLPHLPHMPSLPL